MAHSFVIYPLIDYHVCYICGEKPQHLESWFRKLLVLNLCEHLGSSEAKRTGDCFKLNNNPVRRGIKYVSST